MILATLAADNFVVSFNILHSITYYIRVHNIFSSFFSFLLSFSLFRVSHLEVSHGSETAQAEDGRRLGTDNRGHHAMPCTPGMFAPAIPT